MTGYLHGYSDGERARLYRQARDLASRVHDRLPFERSRRLLEVGSGVGAQTEILLRNFPELHVTGIELNDAQIAQAQDHLATVASAKGRYAIVHADAGHLELASASFDAAFLCWILEHVESPARVLSEVRRMLAPGSPIVCSEVMNNTLFVDPRCPETLRYWQAYNDRQLELGGDPFIGAKVGSLMDAAGFREITTETRPFFLDRRAPAERARLLTYWTELLLSGTPELLAAGKITEAVVEGMTRELAALARDPDAVFFYAFIQTRAVAPG